MKRRILCYILIMAFLGWVFVTSRTFASNDFSAHQVMHDQTGQVAHLPQEGTHKRFEGASYGNDDELDRATSRLGSRPPNCSHKCEGCFPCEPVQIPETTDRVGVQIANYQPEGWKCKCGNSFFSP